MKKLFKLIWKFIKNTFKRRQALLIVNTESTEKKIVYSNQLKKVRVWQKPDPYFRVWVCSLKYLIWKRKQIASSGLR